MKNRLLLIHLCMIALLWWTVETLQSAPASATFNVNDTNDLVDDNPGNGFCHTLAGTCTLRAAVMEANYTNSAIINLPVGIYKLTIPRTGDADFSGALKIRRGTTILGAGAGSTFVDGNGAVIDDRVFDIYTAVTQTATISGITIENGKEANGISGGGLAVLGPLTLANCIVTNNTADRDAGGIWVDGIGFQPVLTMTNCTVSNNTSNGFGGSGFGGGVLNDLGVLTINNSTIILNHAACCGGGLYANGNPSQTVVNGGSIVDNSSGGYGGGVDIAPYSPATLNGVLIAGNTAITNGGGIFNGGNLLMTNNTRVQNNTAYNGGGLYLNADVGIATLSNSSILSNTANNHGGGIYKDHGMIPLQLNAMAVNANQAFNNGGGIYVYDSYTPVRVNQSTVDNNVAGGLGAGVFVRAGTVTFDSSTISNNTTNAQTDDGGGFYNSGTLTLTNSTVSANGAVGYGGGIYNNTGASTGLYNVTIAYNISGLEFGGFPGSNVPGGGIENNGGTVTLRNTIVATNTLENGNFDLVPNDCNGTVSSQGYNLIQTTGGCTIGGDLSGNILGVDPNLGLLAFNGGGTQTNALPAGSPAIDNGNPGGCRDGSSNVLTVDQRGSRRPFPPGGHCDIGAFEFGWWLYLPLIRR